MAELGRMDPFTFAGSKEVDHPVSIRMYVAVTAQAARERSRRMLIDLVYRINLEGDEPPVKESTLFERPGLRHIGSNTRYDATPPWPSTILRVILSRY
jgi:phosphatidylinositol 3-kinase